MYGLVNASDYILKTESRPSKSKSKKFMTKSGVQLREKSNDKDKKNLNTSIIKTEGNKDKKHNRSNHLSISMEKRNLKQKLKTKNNSNRFKGGNNSMEKRELNIKNKIKIKSRKNISITKTPPKINNIEYNTNEKIRRSNLDIKKHGDKETNEKYATFENQPSDESFIDDDDSLQTFDDVIDEEIRELEEDEENIILLMEQIKQFQKDSEKKK